MWVFQCHKEPPLFVTFHIERVAKPEDQAVTFFSTIFRFVRFSVKAPTIHSFMGKEHIQFRYHKAKVMIRGEKTFHRFLARLVNHDDLIRQNEDSLHDPDGEFIKSVTDATHSLVKFFASSIALRESPFLMSN